MIKLMPELFRYNQLLVNQFPPLFLLSIMSIFKVYRWSFTFLTDIETFPLSDRQIIFDTITLHARRNFSMKFFRVIFYSKYLEMFHSPTRIIGSNMQDNVVWIPF